MESVPPLKIRGELAVIAACAPISLSMLAGVRKSTVLVFPIRGKTKAPRAGLGLDALNKFGPTVVPPRAVRAVLAVIKVGAAVEPVPLPKKVLAAAEVRLKAIFLVVVPDSAGVERGERPPSVPSVTLPVAVEVRLPEPSKDKPVLMVISWGEPAPALYRPISLLGPDKSASLNCEPTKPSPVPAV